MSTPPLDRRTFVKTLSGAGLLATLGGASLAADAAAADSAPRRKRYVNVGVGGRHLMYQDAIEKNYPQYAELVGICDVNAGRLELARRRSKENDPRRRRRTSPRTSSGCSRRRSPIM